MEIAFYVVLFLFLVTLFYLVREIKSGKKETCPSREEMAANAPKIMERAFKELGCNPTSDKEGTMFVMYQGAEFYIEFYDSYACIWHLWCTFKENDPNLPEFRIAVNNSNFNLGPRVLSSNPGEDGEMNVYLRNDIVLHSGVPAQDWTLYIKSLMDSFFTTKIECRKWFDSLTSGNSTNPAQPTEEESSGAATGSQDSAEETK